MNPIADSAGGDPASDLAAATAQQGEFRGCFGLRVRFAFGTAEPETGEFPILHWKLWLIVQEAIRRPIPLYQERNSRTVRAIDPRDRSIVRSPFRLY